MAVFVGLLFSNPHMQKARIDPTFYSGSERLNGQKFNAGSRTLATDVLFDLALSYWPLECTTFVCCCHAVPVRGHALISLRRLLETHDAETLRRQDLLLRIFRENLHHADSYIYLAAVQVMPHF